MISIPRYKLCVVFVPSILQAVRLYPVRFFHEEAPCAKPGCYIHREMQEFHLHPGMFDQIASLILSAFTKTLQINICLASPSYIRGRVSQ